MNELNEVTYARLAALIVEIERMLKSGEFEGNNLQLNAALHSAAMRMDGIRDEQIAEERKEKSERERRQDAAVATQLAEMEHRLSAEEQREYAGFLKMECFTRAEFDSLEEFYTKSWDRLSERGKTEMSTRIWEGVRRNEFEFDELPKPVLERETDRTYLQLTGKAKKCQNLPEFSQQAQQEIVQAYEAGDKASAARFISRGTIREEREQSKGEAKADVPTARQTDGDKKATVGSTDELDFSEATSVAPNKLPSSIKTGAKSH